MNQCDSNRRCRICESTSRKPPSNQMQPPGQQPSGQLSNKPEQEATTRPALNENQPGVTTTSVTRSQRRVLLQTARTYAYNMDNSELVPVRVLIDHDSGSQRSYITSELQRRLGLKPIKTELLNLNTFGNSSFSKKECDLVNLRLQGRNGQDVEISALSFNSICSPLPGTVNLESYPSFCKLDLADNNTDVEDCNDIDVLIGSDYYWEVATGNVVREIGGLAAVSSKFGWLVSGPVQNARKGAIMSPLI